MKNWKSIFTLCCIFTVPTAFTATQTMKTTTTKLTNQADDQMKGSATDVEVTRRIRERLTAMDSLSSEAQNVTIVTLGNTVTLSGHAANQKEVATLSNVAKEYAGSKIIKNEVKVTK